MSDELAEQSVAILVADGFEQREMMVPKRALENAGARTFIVALQPGCVQGWEHNHFGQAIGVDVTVDLATAADFDALLIPGSVLSPDALRHSADARKFVREFFHAGKPVAVSCHGLRIVLAAGVVRDRTVTSFPSTRMELISAGANWVDAAVVVDRRLVTSRSPEDLEDFKVRMIQLFAGSRSTEGRRRTAGFESGAGPPRKP